MGQTLGSLTPNIENWFNVPGAYVLVDGQFGSTGKGLFAGYIAENAILKPNWVTTNAGPNSGHTAYYGRENIVTQQMPVASVVLDMMGHRPRTLLNAGAIIDPKKLEEEVDKWFTGLPFIHPVATLIHEYHKEADQQTVSHIASTGKGIGPAIMEKISRDVGNVARELYLPVLPNGEPRTWDNFWLWDRDIVFVETAQGFSLGLNSTFYPHVTSRECTVMQALADARIPAQMVRKVAMCVRTYPIRVGNVGEAHSGDHYPDQTEISFEDIGVEPEFTTVTGRKRRIFTWSRMQFRAAVAANRPDVIFCNFMNYLDQSLRPAFIQDLFDDYMRVMTTMPRMYYGFGPKAHDIRTTWYKAGVEPVD